MHGVTIPVRAFFSVIVALCMGFVSSNLRAETYRVGQAEGNFMQEMTKPAFKEAYKRIGHDLKLVPLPPRRTIVMANAGQTDGVMLRTKKILDEHPNLVAINIPVVLNGAYALTVDPDIRIRKWEDLASYRVGIVNGLMAIEKRTDLFNPIKLNSYDQLLHVLVRERVDVVVFPLYNAMNEVRMYNKQKQLYVQYPPLHTKALYHFVHKSNSAIIPALEQAFNELKDEGFIDRLLNNAFKEIDLPRLTQ